MLLLLLLLLRLACAAQIYKSYLTNKVLQDPRQRRFSPHGTF